MRKEPIFSNLHRESSLKRLTNTCFDLVVIGGGITGAGIALDAVLRGFKTILIEKSDFASGTSSKSTKLIHGGLRYLKQLEIGLVRETGLERAIVHRNIPHLVHPESMLLPIVKGGSFNKFTAGVAIYVYDLLAKVPAQDRKRNLTFKQVREMEALLNPSLLKSGILYSEYRTDDARLTMELIKAMKREGGEAFNYMEVQSFEYQDDKISGVVCKDHISREELQLKSKHVVNASGPWVDNLRMLEGDKSEKSLQLTKGVHVVLPYQKLPLSSSIYFDAFDGRMIFAIPRADVVYVGTSDTRFSGDMDKIRCETKDAQYLLDALNHMFTVNKLELDDIVSSWAGLRPLIQKAGKSPTELSRKDEIFISETGLISIAGGKLTGYRKMARRVVDLVSKKHIPPKQVACRTESYKIHADSFRDYQAYQIFGNELIQKMTTHGITEKSIWYLINNYGKHATAIINNALETKSGHLDEDLLLAEIDYCLQYEMVYLPEDFFNRRSGRLFFNIESVHKNIELIVDRFGQYFNWTPEFKGQQIKKSLVILKEQLPQ